ncbi:MAG: glycosyltransferase family 39 protein [Bacteroidetes bacterium]|nr:MAG: glycosyltransferase family 39 protein [Bacteroidota bacterium]
MNTTFLKVPPAYIILFLVLCCFAILRLDSIGLAYFGDEAMVYGPAVQQMASNGPSMFPGAIQEDLSRGHPMMFHFTAGLFLYLFGNTVTNSHIFALLISLCTLFVVFKISKEFLSDLYSVLVVISVASFPLFIGQSAMVYPEMMLTLFALTTLYFYLKKNPIHFFISASFLLLTKETGILFLFSLAIWNILNSIFIDHKKILSADFIKGQLTFVYPLLPLITFFVLQKIKFGYVFYPEHIGFIKTNYESVEYMIGNLFRQLFEFDYKYWIYLSFALLFLLFHKKISLKHRIIIAVIYFCQYKILYGIWHTNSFIAIAAFIVGSLLIFSVYLSAVKSNFTVKDEMMLVSFLFILIYVLFCVINFFTDRYLIICLPFCLIMVYGLIAQVNYSKQIGIGFSVMILAFNFYFLATTRSNGETTPYYKNVLMVQQEMVDYIESSGLNGDTIYCEFPHFVALNNKSAGFKRRDIWFTIKVDSTIQYNYWITDNFCGQNYYKTIENRKDLKLLKEFKHGNAEMRVYAGF